MRTTFFFSINQSADHVCAEPKILIQTDHGSMMIRCTATLDGRSSVFPGLHCLLTLSYEDTHCCWNDGWTVSIMSSGQKQDGWLSLSHSSDFRKPTSSLLFCLFSPHFLISPSPFVSVTSRLTFSFLTLAGALHILVWSQVPRPRHHFPVISS